MAKVTVVVPCYNGECYLAETIRGVQAQTFSDWRVVIVDDGSSDASRRIMRELSNEDERISVLVHSENRGISAARNSGAAEVQSEYLLFLDADDVPGPEMLEITVNRLDDADDVDAVYVRQRYIGPAGEDLGSETGEWPWARCVPTRFWVKMLPDLVRAAPFESIFLVAVVIPSLALVRSEAFRRVGGFDEDFSQICEDTDLFLRVALEGKIEFIPEVLVSYRRHPAQATMAKPNQFEEQYRKVHEKLLELGRGKTSLVQDAEWFRTCRFVPYRNLMAAKSALLNRDARGVVRNVRAFLKA